MFRLERTFSTFSPHVYNVVSSAKLHNYSVLVLKNFKSFIKILKSNGPNIDPCGIPKEIPPPPPPPHFYDLTLYPSFKNCCIGNELLLYRK